MGNFPSEGWAGAFFTIPMRSAASSGKILKVLKWVVAEKDNGLSHRWEMPPSKLVAKKDYFDYISFTNKANSLPYA